MTLLVRDVKAEACDKWVAKLQREGYCIVRDIVPSKNIAALHGDLRDRFARTPFSQGEFYGIRTKRFGGVLKRSEHAHNLVMHPLILAIAQAILGPNCDRLQLNLTQALEIHPGSSLQVPHRDQNMWQGPKGEMEYLINVMWPFTPYTRDNGATLLWRGSHRCQEAGLLNDKDAIAATMNPGDALIFLGSTLHCAGANNTSMPRAGMVVSYCLGWLKPYENQWLVYPPEVAKDFPRELSGLIGYRVHRPNLGNYEGQCPSILLADKVHSYLGAIDELPPDQIAPLIALNAKRAR